VKFLADMGISLFTVAWLRSSGYDAIHLRDEGLQRLPDSKILIKARQEERVLLTMDLDFGMLLAVNKDQFPSVILFRLSDERSAVVTERLQPVLAQCAEVLETGAIISVSDEAFRVRALPL
jgi:predicted nuclease of predicted toxin-antitoxin system